jgi:MFS family permease
MTTDNLHHSRRWTILAILATAQLMVVLDATIVNIALPSAQRALHFANSERQWIVTAYALAFGSLLLLGGRISDLLGRKWTFIVGLAGALTNYIAGGSAHPTRLLLAQAALHGDAIAFARAAAIFAAGALIAAGLFEHGTKALGIEATAAPAPAH